MVKVQLGQDAWDIKKCNFDGLSLKLNGDDNERFAYLLQCPAFKSFLDKYEQFWKYHVCPARETSLSVKLHTDVNKTIEHIIQLNYSVFKYILEACCVLKEMKDFQGTNMICRYGDRQNKLEIFVFYTGNALQLFKEFKDLIESSSAIGGLDTIPILIGLQSVNLSIQKADSDTKLRNYLTHQGFIYREISKDSSDLLIPDLKQFQKKHTPSVKRKMPWSDFCNLPLNSALAVCTELFDDTCSYLAVAYTAMTTLLDPYLVNPKYQALWGWTTNSIYPSINTSINRSNTSNQPSPFSFGSLGTTVSGVSSPTLPTSQLPGNAVSGVRPNNNGTIV